MSDIEKTAGQLALSTASPFDKVGLVSVDGRYVLRMSISDELEMRVRHRRARNRIGVVMLPPTVSLDFLAAEVTRVASEVAGLPPFTMWAYAFAEDPDDMAGPWQVGVHVDHEEGAERSGSVTGVTREQATVIADAFNLAARLLEDIQRSGVP